MTAPRTLVTSSFLAGFQVSIYRALRVLFAFCLIADGSSTLGLELMTTEFSRVMWSIQAFGGWRPSLHWGAHSSTPSIGRSNPVHAGSPQPHFSTFLHACDPTLEQPLTAPRKSHVAAHVLLPSSALAAAWWRCRATLQHAVSLSRWTYGTVTNPIKWNKVPSFSGPDRWVYNEKAEITRR